jgi:CheY-like chemotaxis protein
VYSAFNQLALNQAMFPENHILVVEDNSDHFHLIEETFRRGAVINALTRVNTAAAAIACLNGDGSYADRERYPLPCLILLDLKLPGESGFTVLEWVRKHPALGKLPVVVLTVSAQDDDIDKAYHLGANSYLVKPFNIDEFKALVKSINSYWVLLAQKPRV